MEDTGSGAERAYLLDDIETMGRSEYRSVDLPQDIFTAEDNLDAARGLSTQHSLESAQTRSSAPDVLQDIAELIHSGSTSTNNITYFDVNNYLYQNSGLLNKDFAHLRLHSPWQWRHNDSAKVHVIDLSTSNSHVQLSMDTLEASLSKSCSLPGSRLYIIEDLCSSVIDIVWKCFGCPHPELFSMHLHRSGYNIHPATESPPERWKRLGQPASYHTIEWYRPGYFTTTSSSLNEYTPRQLLAETGKVTWEYGDATRGTIECETKSNILRACYPLFTKFELAAIFPLYPLEKPRESERCLWTERATVYIHERGSSKNVLLLLDPLPKLKITPIHPHPAMNTFEGLLFDPLRASRTMYDHGLHHSGARELLTYLKQAQIDYDNASAFQSSTDDIITRLRTVEKGPRNAILSLLEIISVDTLDVIRILEDKLRRIFGRWQNATDEEWQHFSLWQRSLDELETQIMGLIDHFEDFAVGTSSYGGDEDIAEEANELVAKVKSHGQRLLSRLRRVSERLQKDLAVLENRRGIEEAESVIRLTELAFIFIPLTFVSSLFSMQVREVQDGVPLSTFVYAAVAAVFLLYSVRLFIRSRLFVLARRKVVGGVRETAWLEFDIQEHLPLPAGVFVLSICIRVTHPIWKPILNVYKRKKPWLAQIGRRILRRRVPEQDRGNTDGASEPFA